MSEHTPRPLPEAASINWMRKQAKRRLRELRQFDPGAKLADAQFEIARQNGFQSWRALKAHIDSLNVERERSFDEAHVAADDLARDDKEGDDPMIDRIRDGRCDLVFDLVSADAPTFRDESGVPLIRWCAYYGDVSAIRSLLANGESLESLGPNFDLNGAAFHGHWRLCEFLIENGADPSYRPGDTGETPLHAALSRANSLGADQVVAVLLHAGANPNVATARGVETGSFMRDSRTRGETPLHRAAAFASEGTIRRLLEAGASLSATDAHGDTALSWASWHLRPAAVIRLLCFDNWSVHPEAQWAGDHGLGWSGIDRHLVGRARV